MSEGRRFRIRSLLSLSAAVALVALSGTAALAQSPDDIPGFDQLPIPGGEDPADPDEPAPDPGPGAGDDTGPQVDAPGGGVDTGAGGLAGEGSPAAVPLAVAGALTAGGGAVLVARRRARA